MIKTIPKTTPHPINPRFHDGNGDLTCTEIRLRMSATAVSGFEASKSGFEAAATESGIWLRAPRRGLNAAPSVAIAEARPAVAPLEAGSILNSLWKGLRNVANTRCRLAAAGAGQCGGTSSRSLETSGCPQTAGVYLHKPKKQSFVVFREGCSATRSERPNSAVSETNGSCVPALRSF